MSSACFHFQSEPVSNQCDKLRICGFSLMVVYGVAEKGINGIYLASVPCYFDGMADGTFHAAGGGVAFLCDGRIQFLRDVPAAAGGILFSVIDLVCWCGIKVFIGVKDSIYCYSNCSIFKVRTEVILSKFIRTFRQLLTSWK